MKKIKCLFFLLGSSLILSSCAAGTMEKVMNNGAIGVAISPEDTIEKKLGDVTFRVQPASKTYNPRYASRDNLVWVITIKNDCSRVYRTKDAERGVWVAGKPMDWENEIRLGYYGDIGSMFQPLTSISNLEVVPGQTLEVRRRYIRAGAHLKYAWPKTIKIGFYDLPICKNGKYSEEVGNLEWVFNFDPKPYDKK